MARNENPGVRKQARDGTHPNKGIDEPWVSNYPPLDAWLRLNNARCDWQVLLGKKPYHDYIEQWRLPGSLPFVIRVMGRQHGWEIFTPSASNDIEKTLQDAMARIYPSAPKEAP